LSFSQPDHVTDSINWFQSVWYGDRKTAKVKMFPFWKKYARFGNIWIPMYKNIRLI